MVARLRNQYLAVILPDRRAVMVPFVYREHDDGGAAYCVRRKYRRHDEIFEPHNSVSRRGGVGRGEYHPCPD